MPVYLKTEVRELNPARPGGQQQVGSASWYGLGRVCFCGTGPHRTATSAAGWPPSALSCVKTKAQNCLHKSTALVRMVPAGPAVMRSSSWLHVPVTLVSVPVWGSLGSLSSLWWPPISSARHCHCWGWGGLQARGRPSFEPSYPPHPPRQTLPLLGMGGPAGQGQAFIRTQLRCGVRPGPGTFLFMGWSRFGEAWLGCAPRVQEFTRAYTSAQAAHLHPCEVTLD
uniref:Adenine nucleotide translocase lysine methyltransferase n=1 Tax=Spermophilus dauricus TaxID=99837 RepID=A0A8C9QDC9_SPEDA